MANKRMWLRVVLLDRHNIWDVHGCRSHTFCLFYCIYYILHTKIIDPLRYGAYFLHLQNEKKTQANKKDEKKSSPLVLDLQ